MYEAPHQCPVCQNRLQITKVQCDKCETVIEGKFKQCDFCLLPKEDLAFVRTFIQCRGNIKDVEKELNISYPTVRSKLDNVIDKLGLKVDRADRTEDKQIERPEDPERQALFQSAKDDILARLSKGELTAAEATRLIKELK